MGKSVVVGVASLVVVVVVEVVVVAVAGSQRVSAAQTSFGSISASTI